MPPGIRPGGRGAVGAAGAALGGRAGFNAPSVRERREYVLPARFDDTPLPGLLPDVSYVDLRGRPLQQFAVMIAAKLVDLGITVPAPRQRESLIPGAGAALPAGAVRADGADLQRLGVHAAISVPGVPDEIPPNTCRVNDRYIVILSDRDSLGGPDPAEPDVLTIPAGQRLIKIG